jgi:hypothetical protein
MVFYAKVEEVAEVKGGGCLLALSPVPKADRVRKSDPIELRRSGGPPIQTHLESVLFTDHVGPESCRLVVMLPRELSEQDVPIGTEVWLTRA